MQADLRRTKRKIAHAPPFRRAALEPRGLASCMPLSARTRCHRRSPLAARHSPRASRRAPLAARHPPLASLAVVAMRLSPLTRAPHAPRHIPTPPLSSNDARVAALFCALAHSRASRSAYCRRGRRRLMTRGVAVGEARRAVEVGKTETPLFRTTARVASLICALASTSRVDVRLVGAGGGGGGGRRRRRAG